MVGRRRCHGPRGDARAHPDPALRLHPACGAGRTLAAAPPTGTATHSGKATFYDSKGAGGNCSNPAAPANRLYVAIGPTEYSAGAACGGFLDVVGPKGSVRVLIMDQCPECAPGHLDLSREAFARIAEPVQGLVPVTYRAVVNPPLPGPSPSGSRRARRSGGSPSASATTATRCGRSRSGRATAIRGSPPPGRTTTTG
ncbi:expansin EXLX1 family cellulose-binding protein [Micromonospora sp. M12]